MIIMHGSEKIIEEPKYDLGKPTNDYGKGFYCTRSFDMACEWACKHNTNGFVNEYDLDIEKLKVLNLFDEKYNVLNWIALLLKNRTFIIDSQIAIDAKEFIIANYYIDLSDYDVVIGYRADDSYFSFAQSFINNSLSVDGLAKALKLGNLGEQVALISGNAFLHLKFNGAKIVNKNRYYSKYISRDIQAREQYKKMIKEKSYINDVYVMDLLREKKND